MKTTIDIPDDLYKRAKIRAIERGETFKQLVLGALERGLAAAKEPQAARIQEKPDADVPYFARRKLLPEFARLEAEGAFTPKPGDRDITDLISDDRDGR